MPAEARIGGGRKSRRRFGIGDFGVRGFFGKANQDMPRFFGVYPASSFALVRGSAMGGSGIFYFLSFSSISSLRRSSFTTKISKNPFCPRMPKPCFAMSYENPIIVV